ncbi:MAG: hypothetical protein M3Z22_06960, partial [Verrucomicrobiota bacterium]|nr:hypothetical protein [Verrucomicrobiota bacterium]
PSTAAPEPEATPIQPEGVRSVPHEEEAPPPSSPEPALIGDEAAASNGAIRETVEQPTAEPIAVPSAPAEGTPEPESSRGFLSRLFGKGADY